MPAVGILGQKRSKYQRPILHNSKSPETSRRHVLELIKNTGERINQRGPTPWPRGWERVLPPGRAPCLVGPLAGLRCPSSNIGAIRPRKKSEEEFWDEAPPPQGGTNLGLRRRCSAGETSLWEGEIITNDPLIGRGSISINISTSTISSQNPSSSLVSNLCRKASDWYLWVASSVDYSLQLMLVGLFGGRSYVQILHAY